MDREKEGRGRTGRVPRGQRRDHVRDGGPQGSKLGMQLVEMVVCLLELLLVELRRFVLLRLGRLLVGHLKEGEGGRGLGRGRRIVKLQRVELEPTAKR